MSTSGRRSARLRPRGSLRLLLGKRPQSTHYGNNVSMADGPYRVFTTVNGTKVDSKITVRNAPGKM